MKTRELLRHLNNHGCELIREGGKHSWWLNPLKTMENPARRQAWWPMRFGVLWCSLIIARAPKRLWTRVTRCARETADK